MRSLCILLIVSLSQISLAAPWKKFEFTIRVQDGKTLHENIKVVGKYQRLDNSAILIKGDSFYGAQLPIYAQLDSDEDDKVAFSPDKETIHNFCTGIDKKFQKGVLKESANEAFEEIDAVRNRDRLKFNSKSKSFSVVHDSGSYASEILCSN